MLRSSPILSILILCLICAAVGCEDDPLPTPEAGLAGRVVDADGVPIAGVAIGLQFLFDRDPLGGSIIWPTPDKPRTAIDFSVPEPGVVNVSVIDYLGEHVATLVDEMLDTGVHSAIWQAEDDAGMPMPSGVYTVVFSINGIETDRSQLILIFNQAPEFLIRPNALSDSDGRFFFPLDMLPFGVEQTADIETYTIIRTIKVWAVAGTREDYSFTTLDVVMPEGDARKEIELTLPSD